ncbi:MAG TPA: hypothetical protein VN088_07165 [Nocardioides sp.]|nr:hypothetical protein [Nocardioides sp.]
MSAAVRKTRERLRRARDRWIDQTLLQVEAARVAIARGEADVLLLGDSSCLTLAHEDTDRRLLPELLAEATGARVVTVANAGFNGWLYAAVLRVLAQLEQRPRAVIATASIRTCTATHVIAHPVYSYPRTLAALDRIRHGERRIRAFGRGGTSWDPDRIAEFRRIEVTTRWGGTRTIGDHLAPLDGAGPPPWPLELERARWDYFHGEELLAGNPGLGGLTLLGERLADYGVPALVNWTQLPVAHGETLFPGEFEGHARANLARFEQALRLADHGLPPLLKPALDIPDFQDARNGTEHYAFSGRAKVARAMADAVAENLG